MKKFLTILLTLLLALSLTLALRSCRKPEEARIVFPFESSQVEQVELFHYIGSPADAQKKVVTDPGDIHALYQTFSGITYLVKDAEALAGAPVYSFRFHLAGGTSYELIYVEYGVKKGEIFSPAADFRYFTSANIGALWYNAPEAPVPAETWELPGLDGDRPTVEPIPAPTATEAADPFDAIVYEGGTFWDSVYGEVTLSEYCEKFFEETRIGAAPLKAARVDMDGDWTDELAVVITELEDMLILHIQDGRVVGREFPATTVEALKTDGTFRWKGHRGSHGISVMEFDDWATRCIAMENPEDQQVYYIDPELFPAYQDMDPGEAFREISLMQENKPDAPWFDLPHGPVPTTPPLVLTESEQALVDVVMSGQEFYDRDEEKLTSTPQYLNEASDRTGFSVIFLQAAAVDFDQDGEKELALWIRVGEASDYGLLVLHCENGQVEGQTYWYRAMNTLKTDGTFHWAGSSSSSGEARLKFGAEWEYEPVFDENFEQKEDVTWVGLPCILELFQ